MAKILKHPIDYIPSRHKYQLFETLLSQEWSMLLDSGELKKSETNTPAEAYKRYDILVFAPTVKLSFSDGILQIDNGEQLKKIKTNQPFEQMRTLLKDYQILEAENELANMPPFCGGLIGYLSYDFGKEYLSEQTRYSSAQEKAVDDLKIPALRMGLYQWALITDHKKATSTIYNFGLSKPAWKNRIKQIESSINSGITAEPSQCEVSQFSADQSFAQYSAAFKQIQAYINSGDCYQINYAQRFQAAFTGEIYSAYEKLALANNSPFSSFIRFNDFQVLSLSPERFIALDKRNVVTQPIKGTLPRKNDPIEDKIQAQRLVKSEKDRAENLMIVDLLRNDLSRTAATNSVKVSELFGHYRFESVHHLISTIESQLAPEFDVFDLLTTSLPGGSITGAPKIRAMQIIDELEPVKRGLYCGIIAYIDFRGKMDSNICIRTLLAKDNHLYCWAGGGLVVDSDLTSEYQETFDKLNKILPILNDSELSQSLSSAPPSHSKTQLNSHNPLILEKGDG